jgi:hypothetical protein
MSCFNHMVSCLDRTEAHARVLNLLTNSGALTMHELSVRTATGNTDRLNVEQLEQITQDLINSEQLRKTGRYYCAVPTQAAMLAMFGVIRTQHHQSWT